MAGPVFFFSLFMIFYIYLGYPALVFLLSVVVNRGVKKDGYEPAVTILISAFNEESVIENTLKNKLDLNYPEEKLGIIVISDGSTDGTDEIVNRYRDKRVRLIRQEPRSGKTAALNLAVPEAEGEILIFSDANSIYDPQALRKLIRNFIDPAVGYVTGKMIYVHPDGSPIGDGCSAYMKYENRLRSWETAIGSVVGVNGGIDAVRKELYRPMNPDQLPDFVLPLKVAEQGYRVVYEPEAILNEYSLKSSTDEYKMRVRVGLRSLWALWDMRNLLSFSSSGLFTWQLWSHKVLRYLCFIFLISAFFTNLALWSDSPVYKILFLAQCIAYLGAIASLVWERKNHQSKILYLPYYFALLNLASVHAFAKFIMGQKMVTWTPRKG